MYIDTYLGWFYLEAVSEQFWWKGDGPLIVTSDIVWLSVLSI